MLYCKILIGNTCVGSSGLATPPPGYQSTVNDIANPSTYVIFDPDHILPLFIIEYTTCWQSCGVTL